MNRSTILSVVIALGSLALAISMRPVEVQAVAFEDTGTPLFPNFSDPAQATSLEVTGWDETGARVTNFKVEQKAGRWVIPSHNDYPADGTERMGKAAASFIDVKKDVLRSDRTEDHAQFGVEDPSDPNAKGRGQRVTIKDQAGTVLVDIILGKKLDDKEGFRYVRMPDQKRVYASKIEVDISTNFTDWIEKDLLKIEQDKIVAFLSDSYKVDEAQGKVTNRDPLLIERQPDPSKPDDQEGTWVLGEGATGLPGKELDSFKIRQIVSGVDRLQIVGVRPRPEQLTLQALQSKGFFVTPDGRRLFGNEGEVKAISEDGVVYTLYFGEITLESGLALTAGTEDPAKPAEPAKDGPEGEEKKDANRYMFVDVAYDPASDRTVNPAGPPPEEPEGAKRAKQLQARFDKWFYVISDASFKQIRKDKAEFFKDATAGATPATTPGKPADKKAADKPAPAPKKPAAPPAAPAK